MFASLDLFDQTNIDENDSADETSIVTSSWNQDLDHSLSTIEEGKNHK